MSNDSIFVNGLVFTMDPDHHVWNPGYVTIRNSQITGVGPMADAPDHTGYRVFDATGCVVMPGLVNCHTHLSDAVHRGLFDEMTLADWIDRAFFPTVASMTEELSYQSSRVSLAELMLSGVTTTAAGETSKPDHRAIDGALQAITESGVRTIVSRMAMDSPDDSIPAHFIPAQLRDDPKTAVSEVLRLREKWNSELVEVIPEPIGVLRCTPDMVKSMVALAGREQVRMFIHIASSKGELENCRRKYGKGCIEYLASLDGLGPSVLLAHCIWMSEAEIELLRTSDTKVAHNPVANLSYAVGIAPTKELLDAGVKVGLGVDGATTNNSLNLWETMKFAMFMQKHRLANAEYGSAEAALEMATIGGARALNVDAITGSLEVGKRGDVIMIDLMRPALFPLVTATSNLVYSSAPGAVTTVVSNGAVLVDGGKLVRWDEREIVEEAQRAALDSISRGDLWPLVRSKTRWNWDHALGSVSAEPASRSHSD